MDKDLLDHIFTGTLAITLIVGMLVMHLNGVAAPEWAQMSLAAVIAFYFRGRVNGQYNNSKMGELDRMQKELQETIERVKGGKDAATPTP